MSDDLTAQALAEAIDDIVAEPAALARHWQAVRDPGDPAAAAAREALFLHYMPYARAMASRLFAGRHRKDVEFDDFVQLANIGLIEAIGRYDPSRGSRFSTFCTPRLRGAVLNGVAKLTEAQEQLSFDRRRRAERIESLRGERTGDPRLASLGQLTTGLAIGFMLEGTGMFMHADVAHPGYGEGYESAEWNQIGQTLRTALGSLSPNERKFISFHYFDALPFEQIASLLMLSKGRVSQLHRAALQKLRAALHPDTAIQITG